jgi:hypothetical protein
MGVPVTTDTRLKEIIAEQEEIFVRRQRKPTLGSPPRGRA